MLVTRAATVATLTLLSFAQAKPYADSWEPARATHALDSAFDADGWTPAPTGVPTTVLQRRADDPRVCGLGGYDLLDINGEYLQCGSPTDTCILNGTDRAHSCCSTSVATLGGWINCNSFTTCLAGRAASDVLSTGSPRGTAFCVGSAPFCASYSWTQTQLAGLTAYGCDSTNRGLDIYGSATGSGARASLFPSSSGSSTSSNIGSTTRMSSAPSMSASTPPAPTSASSSAAPSSASAAAAPSSSAASNSAVRSSSTFPSWIATGAIMTFLSAMHSAPRTHMMTTTVAVAILLILALASQTAAKPHADASSPALATSFADNAFSPNGWTPLPTSGAMAVPDQLRARQASISPVKQDAHVCGTTTGRFPLFELEGRVVTCGDPRATCVLDQASRAASCCATSDAAGWQSCSAWSRCVQGDAAARIPRSEWRSGTVYCASLPNPFCATYTYSEHPGLTAYGCQASSDNPDDVGTGSDTATQTGPTDTPVTITSVAGATTVPSAFLGGFFPESSTTVAFVSSGMQGVGGASGMSASAASGMGGSSSAPSSASSSVSRSSQSSAAPASSPSSSSSSSTASNNAAASRMPAPWWSVEGLALAVPAVLAAA